LEENRIAGTQIDLGHGYDLSFHLAGTRAEVDLGHVLDARRLAPAGFADQIPDVERRAACLARERGSLVHALAPLALDALQRLRGRQVSGIRHVTPFSSAALGDKDSTSAGESIITSLQNGKFQIVV